MTGRDENASRIASAVGAVVIAGVTALIGACLGEFLYGDWTRVPVTFLFVIVATPTYRWLRDSDLAA